MRLYHYTSLENIDKIIKSNFIELFATRYDSLNDPNEFVWGQEMKHKHKSDIEEFLNSKVDDWDDPWQMYPYICSFSKEKDDENMWNLYGNKGKGIILEFEITEDEICIFNSCQGEFIHLLDVTYCNELSFMPSFMELYDKHISKNIKPNINDINEIVPCIKRLKYELEHEIRCYVCNYSTLQFHQIESSDDLMEKWCEKTQNLHFRIRDGHLIPYLLLKFPKTSLKGITLGFYSDTKDLNNAVRYLENNGYDTKSITVKKSQHNKIQ